MNISKNRITKNNLDLWFVKPTLTKSLPDINISLEKLLDMVLEIGFGWAWDSGENFYLVVGENYGIGPFHTTGDIHFYLEEKLYKPQIKKHIQFLESKQCAASAGYRKGIMDFINLNNWANNTCPKCGSAHGKPIEGFTHLVSPDFQSNPA